MTEVSSLEGQFWPFWTILGHFGRFWVDPGSVRGRDDDGGIRQRAAEGLAGSGEGPGTEVGEGSGSDFDHFWPSGVKFEGQGVKHLRVRGQNLRAKVDFGHFGPFWDIFGTLSRILKL